MGVSGRIAMGAQDALVQLLTERRLEEQMQQAEEAQRIAQELQRQQLAQRDREHQDSLTLRREENAQAGEERATNRRQQMNIEGLRQRNVDREAWEREQAPPPRDPLEDYEKRKQIDLKYREPDRPAREPQGSPQWVVGPDGKQSYRIPRDGDQRHDPVAERQTRPTVNDGGSTLEEIKRLAKALKSHKGMSGAFGLVDSMMPTLRQSTADAESLRDALMSLLTLENTDKMKGVLSDSDIKLLRQASTTLNPRMGESAAASELDRIIQMQALPGDGAAVGAPTDRAVSDALSELERRRRLRGGQ